MYRQKIVYKQEISIVILSALLGGCATSPNLVTTAPPAIQRNTPTQVQMPSQHEFLQAQVPDVVKAFLQYEKTRKAFAIESNQVIKIPYGENTPVIYCTPLRTCEIKLEVGEIITGVYPGDTSRWLFEQAVSGEGAEQQAHVIFKPKDYDLVTNAIITTTKRTYNVELHSQKNVIVKEVEFYYPQDLETQWRNLQKEAILERKARQVQISQDTLGANKILDFHYRIETSLFSPKPIWTPLRVFNDGTHVYIQIPEQATTTSLPALFTLGNDSSPKLVNYRIQKPYYIVDELFRQAVMEIGTGEDKQTVTLTYLP